MQTNQFEFCIDAECVKQAWQEQENFLIAYDESCQNGSDGKGVCAIYFSSNDIYFPNTEEIFRKRIVEKNAFEWFGCRMRKARKHIFLRDVFKQWYVTGVNATLNTTDKVADMLRKETNGYSVVTIGSSAGGYAAILFGTLLGADYVLAFNAQLDLNINAREGNKLLRNYIHAYGGVISMTCWRKT